MSLKFTWGDAVTFFIGLLGGPVMQFLISLESADFSGGYWRGAVIGLVIATIRYLTAYVGTRPAVLVALLVVPLLLVNPKPATAQVVCGDLQHPLQVLALEPGRMVRATTPYLTLEVARYTTSGTVVNTLRLRQIPDNGPQDYSALTGEWETCLDPGEYVITLSWDYPLSSCSVISGNYQHVTLNQPRRHTFLVRDCTLATPEPVPSATPSPTPQPSPTPAPQMPTISVNALADALKAITQPTPIPPPQPALTLPQTQSPAPAPSIRPPSTGDAGLLDSIRVRPTNCWDGQDGCWAGCGGCDDNPWVPPPVTCECYWDGWDYVQWCY